MKRIYLRPEHVTTDMSNAINTDKDGQIYIIYDNGKVLLDTEYDGTILIPLHMVDHISHISQSDDTEGDS